MRRVGKNQLRQLVDHLDDRQRQILDAVAQLRMVSGPQVTRLLFGDADVTEASAARMARRELAGLADQGVLRRLERRVGGIRAGSDGHVYALGPVGARMVELFSGRGIPRSNLYHEPGSLFVDHTLAVSELLVRLKEAERHGLLAVDEFQSEPMAWRKFVGVTGTTSNLKPDGFLLSSQGEFEDRWFIEVDMGTERRGALERKLAVYLAYLRSGQEQAEHGVFPRVVWLVPDLARRQFLEDTIAQVGAPEGMFTVALTTEIVSVFTGQEGSRE